MVMDGQLTQACRPECHSAECVPLLEGLCRDMAALRDRVDHLERLVAAAFLQEYREIFAVAAALCLLAALVAGLTIGTQPRAAAKT